MGSGKTGKHSLRENLMNILYHKNILCGIAMYPCLTLEFIYRISENYFSAHGSKSILCSHNITMSVTIVFV